MIQQQLFPDLVVVMEVDVSDVQMRLLPLYLSKWQVQHEQREKQRSILRELHKKNREETIAKRRAELWEEHKKKLSNDNETEGTAENVEDNLEAILDEEFPPDEDPVYLEKEETVEEASDRMEKEIEKRFAADQENLSELVEHLSEKNIPKMTINTSQRLRVVQRQLIQEIQPLVTNRESLFHKSHPISCTLAQNLLLSSYKHHSGFGCWDPVEQHKNWDMIHPLLWPPNSSYPLLLNQFIYFFTSVGNRNTFMLNPLKYLRQPKPSPAPPIKIAVVGPPKSGKTTVAQMFAQKYGLARLSIGSVMRKVLNTQKYTHLVGQMQNYLTQGLVVPDELAIQCLEVVLLSSVCSTRGYVLDGFPMTLKQAKLMGSRSITPMIIVELELDTVEVLKRGLADKMRPKKLHLMHNSAEILHIRCSCYKQEVEHVRRYFRKEYQNWIQVSGLKSKWWIWDCILTEVSISMKYIRSYLERTRKGQAACINRLCITPKELQCHLGEFGLYCPVCLALHHHLFDCSEDEALTHAAEHRGHYYKMCGKNHLERFLLTPDEFVTPGCPHTLKPPDQLPAKLTEIQVKNRFPQQVEMKGFCSVTFLEGKQRTPETYLIPKLPVKVPPVCEPVSLTSLPVLGYLEQGVSEAIIKAMTAVGCLKPKYPFINIQKSALIYVALYLKVQLVAVFHRDAAGSTTISDEEEIRPCVAVLRVSGWARIRSSVPVPGKAAPSLWPLPLDIIYERQFRFPQYKPGCVRKMSKRKSISTHDKSTKRVRFVEEEEEDSEDADDRDQDVERLSPQVLPSGDVSDVGIVKSITLNNFMCHANLGPFAFGSNVNFIVGKNGSGKSAILTGLIVALGGNAQATNRGSSLKGFVKEGESFAVVSITLNNMGKDAYKPEVYGQAIVIDQKITREGIRTYKLKSQSGHIISTKKEDLVAILDYYNIQVNNPVTILTQEMSKYFLHSKGGAEKYKFFMKATQLEQMKDDFVHIKSTKSVTVDKVEQHSECLKDLKRDFLEKEDRYKSLASVNEMYTKLEELKKQMAWALVGEVEKEFEPMKEKLESDRCATNKFNEKVDEWKKKVEVAEGKQKQSHEQLEEITQQVSELQSKCTEFKTEVQRRNADLKSCEVTVHRHKAILRDLEKDKAQLSSKINDLSLSISQATGAESQARMERIAQIEAALEDLTHHTSTLGQQIEQYQHSYRHAIEGQGKMKRELEGLQKSIDANRRQLQSMESSRSNRLQRFGDQMPALLAAIDEAHKKGQFKHRPRGPLGYLISLKDPELALSTEICLKNLVQAFTCDNYDDERVLKSLMTKVLQHGRRPAIITSRFFPQVHDTQRRAVNHPDYPSVLQALEIEDPVVANCLIDQRAIECILLIKNRTEARRVMQGRNPPQNCTSAFSVEGDQIFTNRSYTADQTRANFLSKDVEEGIRHLKREMETQKVQAAHIQQQIRSTDKNISEKPRSAEKNPDRTEDNRGTTFTKYLKQKKTMKLQLELTDLKNVEEPQSEDLRPLEEDLQEIIAKISSKRAEYDEARAQMAELKSAFENAEQEYKQHKQLINTAAEEADVKKEELSKTDQEVMKCKHHEKHYEERRNAHLCSIKTLENNVASKEKELQESIAKAKEICPEQLVVRRTARSLDCRDHPSQGQDCNPEGTSG
ncbi:hypothetical protein fugu_017461 [Takifugu bimaculatus]|uniref:Structural maintenance of chromosomes protein 6 n=1 Tax=Takifugu bimaculatus TaxID=433685 RepID=A0A4Z2BS04_9TELE|nr:hypothetical protein fugu_017461 [Takifugu bimaculatus]